MKYYGYLLGVYFYIFISVKGCERSLEVRGVEDYCWTKNVEVLDRLQQTGKSFLNFARKKLGMEIETGEEPQKCDYYQCIFQELKMLNGDGYPCQERMTTWLKNNVAYNHASILLSRVDECSAQLTKSIGENTFFSGDMLQQTTSHSGENNAPLELQSKCEVVGEYTKCMAAMEKDEHCPVFQYP